METNVITYLFLYQYKKTNPITALKLCNESCYYYSILWQPPFDCIPQTQNYQITLFLNQQ